MVCTPVTRMVYTPGWKCWPEAVSKAKGTFTLAAKDWLWAWATGASEATARTATIKLAEIFVKVRMVVSPYGRGFQNRLHLQRRNATQKSEINLPKFLFRRFGRFCAWLQLIQQPDPRQGPIGFCGARRELQ